jgi:hypothetical protein
MARRLARWVSAFGSLFLASLHARAAVPSPRAAAFPRRAVGALTGSAFAAATAALDDRARYALAREEILAGNVPDFLRVWVPVTLRSAAHEITVFVTPDYLAIGDDSDFLPIPLDFAEAAHVASTLGAALPTSRIVDAVYAAANLRLAPIPLPAGPEMRSMAYVLWHNQLVSAVRGTIAIGTLIAGDKKDVVLTGRLFEQPDREAIYGWHRPDGRPIQPLSLVHGRNYADYSHGIRLVGGVVIVDGAEVPYLDALADPELAPILSAEGVIHDAAALLAGAIRGR